MAVDPKKKTVSSESLRTYKFILISDVRYYKFEQYICKYWRECFHTCVCVCVCV